MDNIQLWIARVEDDPQNAEKGAKISGFLSTPVCISAISSKDFVLNSSKYRHISSSDMLKTFPEINTR